MRRVGRAQCHICAAVDCSSKMENKTFLGAHYLKYTHKLSPHPTRSPNSIFRARRDKDKQQLSVRVTHFFFLLPDELSSVKLFPTWISCCNPPDYLSDVYINVRVTENDPNLSRPPSRSCFDWKRYWRFHILLLPCGCLWLPRPLMALLHPPLPAAHPQPYLCG